MPGVMDVINALSGQKKESDETTKEEKPMKVTVEVPASNDEKKPKEEAKEPAESKEEPSQEAPESKPNPMDAILGLVPEDARDKVKEALDMSEKRRNDAVSTLHKEQQLSKTQKDELEELKKRVSEFESKATAEKERELIEDIDQWFNGFASEELDDDEISSKRTKELYKTLLDMKKALDDFKSNSQTNQLDILTKIERTRNDDYDTIVGEGNENALASWLESDEKRLQQFVAMRDKHGLPRAQYEFMKKFNTIREITTDPEQYRERIREEERKRILEEGKSSKSSDNGQKEPALADNELNSTFMINSESGDSQPKKPTSGVQGVLSELG